MKELLPFKNLSVSEYLFCAYNKTNKQSNHNAHKKIHRNIVVHKKGVIILPVIGKFSVPHEIGHKQRKQWRKRKVYHQVLLVGQL